MFTYTCEKGFFNTAGYKYDWVSSGYQVEGLGIRRGIKITGRKFYVVVDFKRYIVDAIEAMAFVKKFNSYYTVYPKRGEPVELFVISKSLLTYVDTINSEPAFDVN